MVIHAKLGEEMSTTYQIKTKNLVFSGERYISNWQD